MGRTTKGGSVGTVIANAIHNAEITYKDQAGNVLITQDIGLVTTGGTIQRKVPEAEDITIIVDDG